MQNQEVQEQMFSMIARWQQSGISQKLYCEQHGIRYHVFHYWFKRYRDRNANSDTAFIPIHIKPTETDASDAGIELILGDGKRILFHQPISAAFIKAIIS